jgi:hypothetical protein
MKADLCWNMGRDEMARILLRNSTKSAIDIQMRKFMFTTEWDIARFDKVNLLTPQRSFDTDYLMSEIMLSLVNQFFPYGRALRTSQLIVHLDNCRIRFSHRSQAFSNENFWKTRW